MDYLAIALPSRPEELETLTARLTAMGLDSFQIEDERDLLEYSPCWEMADESVYEHLRGVYRVLLYLPMTADGLETLAALQSLFPGVTSDKVSEESWRDNWRQHYKPFLVGERLAVHPEWEPAGDYTGRAVFLSNPGMSFGTGLHATTRLCLNALERLELGGTRLLDIGCGSGILGLCALLLGADSVTAVDIDPLAETASRAGAELNGVADKIALYTGDILTDDHIRRSVGGGYDIICSNIVADIIMALAEFISPMLARGGLWLVSGIISERTDEVRAYLSEKGFAVTEAWEENGWAALMLCRNDS